MAKYRKSHFRNWLEYLMMRGAAALLNALPLRISTAIAEGFSDFFFWILPKRRRAAVENITRAYGSSLSEEEKTKLARQAMRHVIVSLTEFFRIPVMLAEAEERFEFQGTEHMDAAFAKGKGVIFVIAHLGSWEYLAFLPYLRGYPCSVVVRETENPFVYDWIQKLRRDTRLRPIDRTNSVREILRRLRGNELVAILIDQWAGPDGYWGDFFGSPTSTTTIPARLAARTGAALVPGRCLRTGPGRYRIVIDPEVPLETGSDEKDREIRTTLKLNRLLEENIRANPDQWIWTHRRWKPVTRHHQPA